MNNPSQAVLKRKGADGCDIDLLRRLLDADEEEECLAIVGSEIRARHSVDGYLFCFLNESGDALVCKALSLPQGFEAMESTYRSYRFPLADENMAVRCYRSSSVIRVNHGDISDWRGTMGTRFEYWNLRSLVFIPIVFDGKPTGVLTLFSQQEEIDATVIEAVTHLLTLSAEAIDNARRFSVLSRGKAKFLRSAEEREQLIDFFSEANDLTLLDSVHERLIERFLSYFDFDWIVIYLVEDNKLVGRHWGTFKDELREPVKLFFDATPRYELDLTSSALPLAVLKQMTLHFRDVRELMKLPMGELDRNWLNLLAENGYPLMTLVHVPLVVGERSIGLMSLYTVSKILEVDAGQLRLVELLAGFFASAIDSAKLYAEVEELNARLAHRAMHDPLTGLYNFAYMLEELDRRIAEYQRHAPGHRQPFSIILLDIDHFKQFNDTFGHLAGNAALVELSQQIVKVLRRMDIVCRYGGEEFVVILPNCPHTGAVELAERLRGTVERVPVRFEGKAQSITISLGIAEYDGKESTAAFIERADKALYRAKAEGRNRVAGELS